MSGALLLRHGLVTQVQLGQATALQKKDGGSFGECLVRIGAVDEEQLVEFYHRRLMIPRIADAKLFIVSPKVLGLVPADMAAEFRSVPVEVDNEGTVTLVMADPTNNHAVDEIAFFADRFVLRAVGQSPAAAETAGLHVGRATVLALALSGGIAGLVGANFVLGYKHYYEDGFSGGIGYMGIAVAVLGRMHPLGVVAAALLFGTLSQGALAVNALVPKEIVDVLQAVIIFAVVAASPEVRRLLQRRV